MRLRSEGASIPERASLLKVAVLVVLVNAVGSAPALVAGPDSAWFRTLEQPWFYPPPSVFGIVWPVLFTLMGVALWLVWEGEGEWRGVALGLFGLQMAFNVAWTPAFFGLESPLFALAIAVNLWGLVVATTVAFARVDRRAAALLVPYLAWVTFAAVLTFEFWRLN